MDSAYEQTSPQYKPESTFACAKSRATPTLQQRVARRRPMRRACWLNKQPRLWPNSAKEASLFIAGGPAEAHFGFRRLHVPQEQTLGQTRLISLVGARKVATSALKRQIRALFIIATLFVLIPTSHQFRLMAGSQARSTALRRPGSIWGPPTSEPERGSRLANGTRREPLAANSFYAQLANFRAQLLQAEGRRQVALGAPCLSASDCSGALANSHCNLDNFTCACLPYHVQLNETTCLPPSLLGFPCRIDAQCTRKVPHSYCGPSGTCACPVDAFVPYRRDKCLPASQLDDYCLSDAQCALADRHARCRWRIPRVYGRCACPTNYKLIREASSPGQVAQQTNRCAPRLGDACFAHDECQLATPNSICGALPESAPREAAARSEILPPRRLVDRKCECAPGFKEAPNKLDCLERPTSTTPTQVQTPTTTTTTTTTKTTTAPSTSQTPPTSGPALTTPTSRGVGVTTPEPPRLQVAHASSAAEEAKNRYELVTEPAALEAGEAQLASKKKQQQQQQLEQRKSTPPAFSSTPIPTGGRVSSLGKACASGAECKARDPHSDCVGGVCECLVPTARCAANKTGCHPDTFQCRSGQCISWYFVCDSLAHCDDASDEEACQSAAKGGCPAEAFECADGSNCLSLAKLCNGRRECLDGSDERQCGASQQQASAAGNQRQQQSSLNSSLSSPTATGERKCHPRAFECANGQCLPAHVFCNAVIDCADGSDESELLCERWSPSSPPGGAADGAHKKTTQPQAAASKQGASNATAAVDDSALVQDSPLLKADRAAIDRMLLALQRQKQAAASSSGAPGAPRLAPTKQQKQQQQQRGRQRASRLEAGFASRAECGRAAPSAFACANGKCRSSAILCSGVDGCGDNSDEAHCEVCRCQAPA